MSTGRKRNLNEYLSSSEIERGDILQNLERTDPQLYQVIRGLNEALSDREKEIANRDKEIANRDKEIANRDKEIGSLLQNIDFLKKVGRGSTSSTFDSMLNSLQTLDDAGMTWRKPSSDLIHKAWSAVRQSSIISESSSIPADVFSLKPENENVHPAFLKLIETISSILSLNRRNFLLRPSINDHPILQPDIVITRYGLSSCSWYDAFCCIELKTAVTTIKEAVVQGWDYAYASHCRMKSSGLNNFRLGICSNLKSIMVIYLPLNLMESKISPNFSLFPDDWTKLKTPTTGFELLCHALALPIPSERKINVRLVETRICHKENVISQ